MEIVYKEEEEEIDKKKDKTKRLPWYRCRGFKIPSRTFLLFWLTTVLNHTCFG
jgi:hypothetical protein